MLNPQTGNLPPAMQPAHGLITILTVLSLHHNTWIASASRGDKRVDGRAGGGEREGEESRVVTAELFQMVAHSLVNRTCSFETLVEQTGWWPDKTTHRETFGLPSICRYKTGWSANPQHEGNSIIFCSLTFQIGTRWRQSSSHAEREACLREIFERAKWEAYQEYDHKLLELTADTRELNRTAAAARSKASSSRDSEKCCDHPSEAFLDEHCSTGMPLGVALFLIALALAESIFIVILVGFVFCPKHPIDGYYVKRKPIIR